MTTPSRWQSIPRRSAVIFLIAVFFIFASFGFTNDVIDMGLQPPLRFAVGVLLSGSFAVAYAAAGMILRGRFWKAFVPLFLLQFACMTFLGYLLPEAARPAQINAFELGRLQTRLVFDGLAIIVSVCLGYAGF